MKNSGCKFSSMLAAWFLCITSASAQQATEVYIPLGESPGVSRSASLIGVIASVDYATHSIVIRLQDGDRTVGVTETTLYYLDRSAQRRRNSTGTLHDCEAGQTIEAKISDDGVAEWIKIEAD